MHFVDDSIGSHVKSQTPLGEEPNPSSALHCSPPGLVFRARAFTDENQIAKVHLRQLSPDLSQGRLSVIARFLRVFFRM